MNAEPILLRLPQKTAVNAASRADRLWAIVAIALVSGLFFLSDDHRYGIAFLREGVIALSFLALTYVLMTNKYIPDRADWYLLVMVGVLFVAPPAFAYLNFQQPIQFGFLEERRALLYLAYFLLIAMVWSRRKTYAEQDIANILKYLFLLALAWSAANAFELIPRNTGFSFSVNAEQFSEGFISEDERYATRFLQAGFLVALYPYYLLARGEFKKAIIPLTLLALYMVFINQTRGMALAIILTSLWILLLRQRDDRFNISALAIVPAVSLLTYFSYFLYVQAFETEVFFYDYHRNRELHLVLERILQDWFIPHGSLSLQFNEGLLSIFGISVFLSDIGFIGLLFKYGLLFIPLVFLIIMIVRTLYGKYRNDFSVILMALLMADFIIAPFGDPLGRGAEEFAVILLLVRLQGVFDEKKYIACIRRGGAS